MVVAKFGSVGTPREFLIKLVTSQSILIRKKSRMATCHFFESTRTIVYDVVLPQYKCNTEKMTASKTATLSFRIEPALKEALREAAERERRSIANMIEVLIRDHCGRSGITIHEYDIVCGDTAFELKSAEKNEPSTISNKKKL